MARLAAGRLQLSYCLAALYSAILEPLAWHSPDLTLVV
jgi:hypothetical protein